MLKIDPRKVDIVFARKCMRPRDLKDAAGISETTMYRALRGESTSAVVVGKIARALGVDVLEILEDNKTEGTHE